MHVRTTNPMLGPSLQVGRSSKGFAAQRQCRLAGRRRAGWLQPCLRRLAALALPLACCLAAAERPAADIPAAAPAQAARPPRVAEAGRFLAQRGWTRGRRLAAQRMQAARLVHGMSLSGSSSTALPSTWTALGPAGVLTQPYNLVGGRVSAVALDPNDASGNRLYIGTTGGGVWVAQNAAVGTSSLNLLAFTPLTDTLTVMGGAVDASLSIGALTVQPGNPNVILAGTGDPNDVLDSYYGAGILRSADGGATWTLIQMSHDFEDNLAAQDFGFIGEGFAGFAWSTTNPQLVVAAVSQAYEGTLVDAERSSVSYQGLYYSSNAGLTWHLATISDGSGKTVQGPLAAFDNPDGNAATAVVWNPQRGLFLAAVRFHGYYQSADGINWTRLATQPGSGLSTTQCPANPGSIGSIACPLYRGALAVNPVNGDTFLWTVDLNNQDQGLWQDVCALTSGSCSNSALSFAQPWSTAALDTSTTQGAVTLPEGGYTLALAAVPSGTQSTVYAGAVDLWKASCPVAQGCAWRNTTNATTCMSAQVGPFQHVLAWNASNPAEMFIGNDSGLWRSMDGIAEAAAACDPGDASHFQNLNGRLQNLDGTPGSLAEVTSLPPAIASPYTMLAGLGVNGAAGVKATAPTADWPQVLGGYGGPVAIDPTQPANWYVNSQAGVAIGLCAQSAPCTPSSFGATPVVNNADVGGDGAAMATPAPFLIDPLDSAQLLVGTCRLWRGPANGSAWSAANVISPVLDTGATGVACGGDTLIRSLAAMALPDGSEVIYAGMQGAASGSVNLAGHILRAVVKPPLGKLPAWQDLTSNPVTNDSKAFNAYAFDLSSIAIDPHDTSGNTVYVTVEGMSSPLQGVQTIYRTTDGGAHWTSIAANLPFAPASSVVVDPQDANTVYVATDLGVYYTPRVTGCTQAPYVCWSVFGTGLPGAPAVGLSTTPLGSSTPVLVAATYGRGLWQTPLWSAATALTAAAANPANLIFPDQGVGSAGSALTVQLVNTGNQPLLPTLIVPGGDFIETNNCEGATVAVGGSCSILVSFAPSAIGARTGQLTVYANIYGGQLTVDLNGNGTAAGSITLAPVSLNFGQVAAGSVSATQSVWATNSGSTPVPISALAVSAPFQVVNNGCGTTTLAPNASCEIKLAFSPTQTGAASGTLVLTDGAGTQTVQLGGTGAAPPTDTLSLTSLAFPATAVGQSSAAQTLTLTNSGDLSLASISIAASGPFQTSNNCTTVLGPHLSCTLSVTFVPTQAGSLTGTLTVADALQTQTVALSGSAVAPAALSVTPASLDFSNQQPGVASAPQTLTITNSGGASLANVGFQVTGPAAASYSLGATTCGALLGSGSSCTVQIVFTPSATGSIAAVLAVSSSTLGVSAVSVPLNGAGLLASGLQISPAQLPFPVVGAGQSSTAQLVTILNTSSYAIGSVALAATAPFNLTQNTCAGGLNAGATCTAAVIFQPTASGAATGSLTVSSAVVAAPATATLSGTGFDFSLSVIGSSSQTAASGQQADYTLMLTPSGASGSFTFQCGTLPANALCLFNPATETLPSGVQGNVQVMIYTGQSGLSVRLQSPAGARSGWLLACGFLLLPLALFRQRRALLAILLAALLGAGLSSCTSSGGILGSGTSGQGSGSRTPAGAYTIPVTVTSTGVSHALNLTLTVD